MKRQFNPYSDNGGTILAIAGADFTIIAGDTRQSEGYNIQTRYAPKVFRLYVYIASRSFIEYTTDASRRALQNRPRGVSGERIRGGRQYVCEEGQAKTRSMSATSLMKLC